MKRYFLFIAIFAVLFCTLSCTKDQPSPEDVNVTLIKFQALRESSDAGKAYINDWTTGTQYWSKGDKVAIDAGGVFYEFVNSSEDGVNALLEGSIPQGQSVSCALYPATAAISATDLTITAFLPSVQTAYGNGVDPSSLLSAAVPDGSGNLLFKNAFSLIMVTVPDDETDITSIVVEGNNKEPLAGEVCISMDGSNNIEVVPTANSVQSVTLSSNGNALSPGIYAISVIPSSFTKGLKFIIKHSNSVRAAIRNTNTAYGVARNHAINFDSSVLSGLGDADFKYYYIQNRSDLIAWNNAYENWQNDDKVVLGNDIELDNDPSLEPWTAHDFAGTFDGKGHAIKKIHVSNSGDANFFGEVSGTIKNLTFGAEDDGSYFYGTASSGSCYIAPIKSTTGTAHLESLTNYATVDLRGNSGYCIAGICGGAGNSDNALLNCKNYGTVKVSSNTTTTINLAGVVASTSASLTGCENHGSVSIENTTAGGTFNFGGVAGYATNAITFENCVNTADLTISDDTTFGGSYLRLGGILSYNNGAGVIMRNCTNEGDLICDAADFSTRPIYAGGMIGQQQSSSESGIRLTMCTNEGDITLRTLSNGGNVFMGGMIGYRNNNGTASDGIIGVADSACVNLGVLSDYTKKSANNSQNVYMGGMVGWNDMPLTLTNCINGESGSVVKGALYERGQVIYPNFTALAGMVGWQTTTASGTDVELAIDGCYNYGPISNQGGCKTKNIYLAGVVGGNEAKSASGDYVCFNVNIANTHNLGSVSNYCETSSQIRIGGFIGDCANNISISGSSNSGVVSSSSVVTGSQNLRLGGFVGSITRGTTRTFSSCSNTGSISGENTSATALTSAYAAGICAYVNAGTNTFNGCTSSSSSVSVSGTVTTKNCAAITAVTAAATGAGITNCGVRGTVSGTTLDSTNYEDYIYCGDKANLGSGNYYWE